MRQCTSVTDRQTDWHHGISARCIITSRANEYRPKIGDGMLIPLVDKRVWQINLTNKD